MYKIILLFLFLPLIHFGQNYTSYFTGNTTNITTNPMGGICLMGGASEDDNAMKWFLQRANGGDILVLRTSGSDGYNDYLYSDLGITVNSVETIVFNNATASSDPYILQKIQNAEAIWFAGGDQWNYVSYWRNTDVDIRINEALENRNIVIGGTSAGMAIQGKYYFSAQNGTVTSAAALANPFDSDITVDNTPFIENDILNNVITDTHFDDPDRKGRLITFLARIYTDYGVYGKAIACDEYTAVCINENGIAKVYGGYPSYDDNAYFIQTNCELTDQTPENCTNGNPLSWNYGGQAIKVYKVKGTSNGANTLDLNNWQDGTGGIWEDWSVSNGTLAEQSGNSLNCEPLSVEEININYNFKIFPNPISDKVSIISKLKNNNGLDFKLFDRTGKFIPIQVNTISDNQFEIKLSDLTQGVYLMTIEADGKILSTEKIIKK